MNIRGKGLLGTIVSLAILFTAGYFLYSLLQQSKSPTILLLNAIDQVPQDATFDKSNFEWLTNIGLTQKGFIKSSIIATTLKGTVEAINVTDGSLKISSRHYYVGRSGYYDYAGTITLKTDDGKVRTFYFSPTRMANMKVFKESSLRKLTDIKAGDKVEITETVDLAVSNINDANFLSLDVRILQTSKSLLK